MNLVLILLMIILPIIGGISSYFLIKKNEKFRAPISISLAGIEMMLMIILALTYKNSELVYTFEKLFGIGISFEVNGFNLIFNSITIFVWLITTIFSKEYMAHDHAKARYYLFNFITLGGVVGVFFSKDLFTTFIFFELMSLGSCMYVVHEETSEARKSALSYLSVAIISGMILLMGLFVIYSNTNTLDFASLRTLFAGKDIPSSLFIGGILTLIGFGSKAGMFPIHFWLPSAHPVAPSPASAILSGILTKCGVFGIIVIACNIFITNHTFGMIILILSLITMVIGALIALFSVNLKKTLAGSSISQIGFILFGIAFTVLLGEEGGIASTGSLLHMANHSLIKLILFLVAGVVLMNIHTVDLNEIRGYGRKKPFLMIIFLIASLGVMGIPFFNGYVSKTLIHEALVEYIAHHSLTGGNLFMFKAFEYIFLFSGGLTIAYMTKIFVCLFIDKNPTRQEEYDNNKNYLSLTSKIALGIVALVLVLIGNFPNFIISNILSESNEFFNTSGVHHEINFLSLECLKGAFISISIGVVIYFFIVRLLLISKNREYKDVWPKWLDLQKLVYIPLIKLFYLVISFILRLLDLMMDGIILLCRKTFLKSYSYKYEKKSLSYRIGSFFDRIVPNKEDANRYAKKSESIFNAVNEAQRDVSSTFTFALAMICVGIVVIISILLIF